MKGNITKRGENSWRLKFDAGRDANGKRKIQYHTFRGSKRQAQVRLAELIASVSNSTYIEPAKVTVGQFVSARIDQWAASGKISAVTANRYRELNGNQIAPFIGAILLQKLRRLDVEKWHTDLRTSGRAKGKGGISARTIGHAHRVLAKALTDAAKDHMVASVATQFEKPPK